MANLGDIVTRLTVDRRDFQKGLASAGRDAEQFGKQGTAALGKGRGGLTFAMLELSRGAEDAAVSFGTGGLAGAIRGGANNAAAFAAIINPMAGVVVGLGAALASVLVPRLLETGDAAEKARKGVEGFRDAWKGLADPAFRLNFGGRGGGLAESVEAAQGALQTARDRQSELRTRRRFAEDQLIAAADTTHLTGGFGQQMITRIMQTDASRGGSVLRQMERELLARGGTLPEDWATTGRPALLKAEAELQKARLNEEFGAVDARRAASELAQVRRRTMEEEIAGRTGSLRSAAFADAESRQATAFAVQDQLTRQGIAAGLGGRLSTLQQQRQMLMLSGANNRSPELATRGNAVDRIIEIAQAKRDAKQDRFQKTQIEKLDAQIERLDKLIEEVKHGDGTTLKPAGIG